MRHAHCATLGSIALMVAILACSTAGRTEEPDEATETLPWNAQGVLKSLEHAFDPFPKNNPWPVVRLDITMLNTPPDVPPLPPLFQEGERRTGMFYPELKEGLDVRMEWLHQSLPNDAYQHFVKDHPLMMMVNGLSSERNLGGFRPFPGDPPTGLMSVNWQFLAEMDRDPHTSTLEAWITLYHEIFHYQQFIATPENEREFWFKFEPDLNTDECTRLFRYEIEAYWATCEIAWEWGVPHLGGRQCFYMERKDDFLRFLVFLHVDLSDSTCKDQWLKDYEAGAYSMSDE